MKPDTKVPVEIIRNGEQKTLEVTVKQQPGTEQLAENGSSSSDTGTLNGVGVGDLDQQARQQYNIPKDVTGALITQVDPFVAVRRSRSACRRGDRVHQPASGEKRRRGRADDRAWGGQDAGAGVGP